jgi:hypothetical protein
LKGGFPVPSISLHPVMARISCCAEIAAQSPMMTIPTDTTIILFKVFIIPSFSLYSIHSIAFVYKGYFFFATDVFLFLKSSKKEDQDKHFWVMFQFFQFFRKIFFNYLEI